MPLRAAKEALDRLIGKSKAHWYKPIQIAEILRRYRLDNDALDPSDVETYRNASKQWRNEVTRLLVESISTSSARYQDDLFNETAMPPKHIASLAQHNAYEEGMIEAYIYGRFRQTHAAVHEMIAHLRNTNVADFDVRDVFRVVQDTKQLKKSADRIYEIVAYSLFASLLEKLDVAITVSVGPHGTGLAGDFPGFLEIVVGLADGQTEDTRPARIYRTGMANAADAGIDMWANYGPIVQVKHVTLDPAVATGIAEGVRADRIIIVCCDADVQGIEQVLRQVGLRDRIQGIVGEEQMSAWYDAATSDQHVATVGVSVMSVLRDELAVEFPHAATLADFIHERDYDLDALPDDWALPQ